MNWTDEDAMLTAEQRLILVKCGLWLFAGALAVGVAVIGTMEIWG